MAVLQIVVYYWWRHVVYYWWRHGKIVIPQSGETQMLSACPSPKQLATRMELPLSPLPASVSRCAWWATNPVGPLVWVIPDVSVVMGLTTLPAKGYADSQPWKQGTAHLPDSLTRLKILPKKTFLCHTECRRPMDCLSPTLTAARLVSSPIRHRPPVSGQPL